MPTVTPEALTRTVQGFLSEAAGAVVLENGAVAFDLAQSKYSISGKYNDLRPALWRLFRKLAAGLFCSGSSRNGRGRFGRGRQYRCLEKG
jgi:hypothetical protein